MNVIGNGIKFHRPDVSPEITISAEADGGDWLFRVQDNGIGIEAGYLDRVFGMFQRLHTREEYEGTGLGLSSNATVAGSGWNPRWDRERP